jgi:hypothetical protein
MKFLNADIPGKIFSLAYSSNGQFLAVAYWQPPPVSFNSQDEGPVSTVVWDLHTQQIVFITPVQQLTAPHIRFLGTTNLIGICTFEQIEVWDVVTKNQVFHLEDKSHQIGFDQQRFRLVFPFWRHYYPVTPDMDQRSIVEEWSINPPTLSHQILLQDRPDHQGIGVSPDGSKIVFLDKARSRYVLFDFRSESVEAILSNQQYEVQELPLVAWSEDGNLLLLENRMEIWIYHLREPRIYDFDQFIPIWYPNRTLSWNHGHHGCRLTPDATRVFVTMYHNGRHLFEWSLLEERVIHDWSFPVDHLGVLAIAPDQLTAALGTVDNRVLIWDLD